MAASLPPWRQSRPAELREQVGEVLVREDGAEQVAQLEEKVALAEGGPRDARRLPGHGLDRAGLERHGGYPAACRVACRRIPAHLSSADFTNDI